MQNSDIFLMHFTHFSIHLRFLLTVFQHWLDFYPIDHCNQVENSSAKGLSGTMQSQQEPHRLCPHNLVSAQEYWHTQFDSLYIIICNCKIPLESFDEQINFSFKEKILSLKMLTLQLLSSEWKRCQTTKNVILLIVEVVGVKLHTVAIDGCLHSFLCWSFKWLFTDTPKDSSYKSKGVSGKSHLSFLLMFSS